MKNKFTTILILTITFILAGVAIFTAIRLYQLRNKSISPTSPESQPAAAGQMCGGIAGKTCPAGEACVYSDGTTRAPFPDAAGVCQPSVKNAASCTLNFSLGSSTPTPTPTGSSTATASATATATATATSTSTSTASATATSTSTPGTTGTPISCGSGCTSNGGCQSSLICYQGACRNPSCVTESDCGCQGTSTTTPVGVTATQPSLPNSGTSWPTFVGAGLGILVVLGSLLLAL